MKYIFIIALISLSLITACKEEKEETIMENPHAGMDMKATHGTEIFQTPEAKLKVEGKNISFENVTLELPENWIQEKPSSSMRVVQFFVKDNEDLVIAGFYFGNRDNMVDANINRWKSQFTKVNNLDKKDFAGGKAVLVEIEGTYKKRPSEMVAEFEEEPSYKTLAAIVSTDNAPYFFKMLGPADKVNNEVKNFENFLNSYKAK
jgi:hypothetical protein